MNLALAKHYADQIKLWIEPFCDRVEIAGSVRRGRPVCNDIDIVCIPKVRVDRDMFQNPVGRTNYLLTFLRDYVGKSGGRAKFVSGGDHEGKQVIMDLPKCQLDLWFAEPENFGTRLLVRTGSKEHNVWLAGVAKAQGKRWATYDGVLGGGQWRRSGDQELYAGGSLLACPTEEAVYAALGVPFIQPDRRDGPFPKWELQRVIEGASNAL